MSSEPLRYAADDLKSAAVAILCACGVNPDHAQQTADCLVSADLRGVDTHGLIRLRFYVDRLRAGGNNPRPNMRIVRESPTCALIDADNGLGPAGGTYGMQLTIAKASDHGMGAVVVRNCNHYGAAAYYAMMALSHDMVGLSMTNTLASMAPTGGTSAAVGNNPFAIAFPSDREPPIVLDMATSKSSWGALMVAAQSGAPLPAGCFLGPDGTPTVDPQAVMAGGFLLPIAGYKGYGLALCISMLTGIMADWTSDPDIVHPYKVLTAPGDNSYFMLAMRVDGFSDPQEFRARADAASERIRAIPPAEGTDRVWLPGEKEFETEKDRAANGIPLAQETLREMRELAAELDVALPF